MSITRRNALALTGSGIAAALAGIGVAAGRNLSPTSRADLIDSHRAALAASETAWRTCSEIMDANPLPLSKVEVGRMWHGRNDDGSEQFAPIYAYSEEDIEAQYHKILNWELAWHRGSGQAVKERNALKLARKLAGFRRQEFDREQAEQVAGITAAQQAGKEASAVVDRCFSSLTARAFSSVEDVAETAAYVAQCYEALAEGVDDDAMVAFVKTLAGARAS